MENIRNSFWTKGFALTVAFVFLVQIFSPTQSYALTGGPSQPEVQSFMSISVSDMVDISSGDFHYNIPLMQVGDYPINLLYNSGISTDEEASWVGLGWNINPGVINRQMRTLPDDFKGDEVKSTTSMKPNRTYGLSVSVPNIELSGFSFFNLSFSLGVSYNNYTGVGFSKTVGIGVQLSEANSESDGSALGLISISQGLDGPLTVKPDLSLSRVSEKKSKRGKQAKKRGTDKDAEKKLRKEKLKEERGRNARMGGVNQGLSLASYLISGPSYTPTVKHPMMFVPLSVRLVLGGGAFLVDGQPLRLTGYYNQQKLRKKSIKHEAYGYNYLQYADKTSMLDFNRDNDVAYKRTIPYLPNPVIGYDSYVVNGQGIGGMFRPYRSDFGSLHDAKNFNGSVGGSLGIETDVGNLIDFGFDVQVNSSQSYTRNWSDNNRIEKIAKFRYGSNGKLYEPFYFKFLGDIPFDEELADIKLDFLGEQAVRMNISNSGIGNGFLVANGWDYSSQTPTSNTTEEFSSSSYPKRNTRVKRESMISYVTAGDVKKAGLTGWKNPNSQKHHIAEITVTKENGARYVYGRAAYNISQTEMQFNVSGEDHYPDLGLSKYSSTAATTNNSNGIDEYFNEKSLPPYAHSYLITAVLSSDYVDADEIRGPSVNDFGSYTLFNYAPTYTYNWRTPNKPSTDGGNDAEDYYYANLSEGAASRDDDDMGAVVEGKKELHYVREIRSKHQVAVFTTSNREDSKESGSGSNTMQKLDRIDLYSLPDYEESYANATPIKTVHFKYSYSLCPGIYNSTSASGKLTLEKVYFTYGKSNLSAVNNYSFEYDDVNTPTANYSYHPMAYDAWGNYKPHDAVSNPNGTYNSDFPYLNQDFNTSNPLESPNQFAKAWNLKSINLPSGGKIEIDLEADQYTHVQNRRALQMVQVIGVSDSQTNTSGDVLYTGNNPNLYIHFKIPQGQYSTGSEFIQSCVQPLISGDKPVYFNFSVDVMNNNQGNDRIKGYFKVDNAGVSSETEGWIKIHDVSMLGGITDGHAHPVAQASWNFAKIHHPKQAYGFPEIASGGSPFDWMLTLASNGLIGAVAQVISGPDVKLRNANFGRVCDPSISWFRVFAGENGKFGGGSRVKEIRILDNWNQMTEEGGISDNYNAAYGQKYTYTLANSNVSSGVATFEPTSSQENPFIEPVFYKENRVLVPEESFYLEGPVARSFYPSPKVTYSRVEVKSLYLQEDIENPGSGNFVDVSAIGENYSNGFTVHEFYTSKDFPTKTSATTKDPANQLLSSLIGSLFNFYTFNWETISQGFYAETNDMDGKLKSQSEYNSDGVLMTRTENVYQTRSGSDPGLDNTVLMVDKDLSVKCEEVGVEFELYHDFKENYSISETVGFQPNVGTFMLLAYPLTVPAFFPDISVHETRLRTAATMKVVHKHGLLKEVKTFNQGAEVITRNLAYDRESGEVLLSSATNEYNEEHFSFAFPAHWKYPLMGGAYQNEGYTATGRLWAPSGGNQETTFYTYDPGQVHALKPGDEVLVTDLETLKKTKAWVYQPESLPNNLYLIDRDGNSLNTDAGPMDVRVMVIRSGNRNMQGMAMGSITTLHNPLGSGETPSSICEDTGIGQLNFAPGVNETKVLQASASTYSEDWKTFASNGGQIENPCANLDYLGSLYGNYLEGWIPILNELLPYITPGNTLTFTESSFPLGSLSGYFEFGTGGSGGQPVYHSLGGNDTWTLSINSSNSGYPSLTLGFTSSVSPNTSFLYIGQFYTSYLECENLNLTETWYDEFLALNCSGSEYNNSNAFFAPMRGEFLVRNIEEDILGTAVNTDPVHYKSFFPLINLECPEECPAVIDDIVNPYVAGLMGNWRLDKEWAYKGEREYIYDPASNLTNIREDGYFTSDFSHFWQYDSNEWTNQLASDGWIASRKITEYSPFSTEVENVDPLHRFSAAVFGYNHKVPVCMANNASYNQIGFDSFEDYSYYEFGAGCRKRHFAYEDYDSNVTMDEAHTGYYSLKVEESEFVSTTRTLETVPLGDPSEDMPYLMQPENDLGLFGPETYDIRAASSGVGSIALDGPSKYILSYWVREIAEDQKITTVENFAYHSHQVLVNGMEVGYGEERRSPVIDGWQRIEREFFIPAGASGDIIVKILGSGIQGSPTGNGVTTYIDDIRVHPFNSSFKSFTYDYITLRLMAELDENNFATFYEYDPEGNLIRMKKETERGIMTLKEYRKDLPFTQ